MSYRHAAPAYTVGDRDVKNSDNTFNKEQSPLVLEENKKKSYNKDNKVSNFFTREARLICV
jgi:hypothetical protein